MEMSYYFSSTAYDFLFSGVDVVTTWGMVSLCIGLASLSLLSEGFKVARSLLMKVAVSSCVSGCTRYNTSERLPLLQHTHRTHSETLRLLYQRRVKFHILQTFLHILHLTIGYVLMLAVMTYNAYFTLAVVGGAGLGYYCFSLFDLPSKILGTLKSTPAQWPVGGSPSHQSEGVPLKHAGQDPKEECVAAAAAHKLTMPLTAVLKNGIDRNEAKACEQGEGSEKPCLRDLTSCTTHPTEA